MYPNEETKPAVGFGLNRSARITLDQVWPKDKSTGKPIMDAERLAKMDYEGRLRTVSASFDAPFVKYIPQTGSWIFDVNTIIFVLFLVSKGHCFIEFCIFFAG